MRLRASTIARDSNQQRRPELVASAGTWRQPSAAGKRKISKSILAGRRDAIGSHSTMPSEPGSTRATRGPLPDPGGEEEDAATTGKQSEETPIRCQQISRSRPALVCPSGRRSRRRSRKHHRPATECQSWRPRRIADDRVSQRQRQRSGSVMMMDGRLAAPKDTSRFLPSRIDQADSAGRDAFVERNLHRLRPAAPRRCRHWARSRPRGVRPRAPTRKHQRSSRAHRPSRERKSIIRDFASDIQIEGPAAATSVRADGVAFGRISSDPEVTP